MIPVISVNLKFFVTCLAGINRDGFDVSGYDRRGFNRYGFDRNGYDERGFNPFGYHRSGGSDTSDYYNNQGNTCSFFSPILFLKVMLYCKLTYDDREIYD